MPSEIFSKPDGTRENVGGPGTAATTVRTPTRFVAESDKLSDGFF